MVTVSITPTTHGKRLAGQSCGEQVNVINDLGITEIPDIGLCEGPSLRQRVFLTLICSDRLTCPRIDLDDS